MLVDQPWQPDINWETPAGRALRDLARALPRDQPIHITVFGSAPLQLGIDAGFLSADVDVFSQHDLRPAIERAGLGKGQREIYIDQTSEFIFSAGASWRERAFSVTQDTVTFVFPHPIDILVSKIKRLDAKDLNAFRLVHERTGHPTPDELKYALQRHVDLFRPNFDEENSGDPIANTQTVWREIYQQTIDVRGEIIAPALRERCHAYGVNLPALKDELPD